MAFNEEELFQLEWIKNHHMEDKDKVLDADDNVSRSTVSPELTGRNTIEVTNKPAVVRVKNKAEGSEDWTEWKYFDAFTNDDHSGAFDYANSLNGEVVIETLLEEHENNTLDSGFEFTNQAITSLTIQSADTLTNERKHSHLVGSTDGSLLTFNTGGPVRINNLEFDGHGHIQNADGGAINITSGSATLTNVQIHDFSTRGKGAAVYVGDDVSLTLSESEIKHNSSSGENGGAVNVILEEDALMREGNLAGESAKWLTTKAGGSKDPLDWPVIKEWELLLSRAQRQDHRRTPAG